GRPPAGGSQSPTSGAKRAVELPADGRFPVASAVARDSQGGTHPLTRTDRQLEKRGRGVQMSGRRLKFDTGDPLDAVETEIAQRHRCIGQTICRDLTAARALLPSYFEEIGKIGGKSDAQPDKMLPRVEIVHEQPLVARVSPYIFEAID